MPDWTRMYVCMYVHKYCWHMYVHIHNIFEADKGNDRFMYEHTVEVGSKTDLTVKSQFPAVRQSILYGGKKV